MLKASEILLETIKKDGRPERLLRQYEGATFYPPNPANNYVRGNRHRGMEPMKDLFGTEILWPQEQLAAMPHVTEDNKVIDDITEWKEQLVRIDSYLTHQHIKCCRIRLYGNHLNRRHRR